MSKDKLTKHLTLALWKLMDLETTMRRDRRPGEANDVFSAMLHLDDALKILHPREHGTECPCWRCQYDAQQCTCADQLDHWTEGDVTNLEHDSGKVQTIGLCRKHKKSWWVGSGLFSEPSHTIEEINAEFDFIS